MSKALGSTGGFIGGSAEVIEYLRTNSKQTIFSAAISPCQAACAQAALEVIRTEPEHLQRLWENTRIYQQMLSGLSFDTWESETPRGSHRLGQQRSDLSHVEVAHGAGHLYGNGPLSSG